MISTADTPGFFGGKSAVEAALQKVVASEVRDVPSPVKDAICYALSGGGKRLRGMLVLAAYDAAGGTGDASTLAAAVEIIHAYSLAHDDLPFMDDDDLRRGRPTVHRAFALPVAVLTGAAMIPISVRVLLRGACELELDPETQRRITAILLGAAGASGMIGGQLRDLEGETLKLSAEQLDELHVAKTGALICASLRVGGAAAGATDAQLNALSAFGRDLGLAFQIRDDVLDVTSSAEYLGKSAGRDAALGKSTYPLLYGTERALVRANGLIQRGCEQLRTCGLLTRHMENLARFTLQRTH